MIQLPPTTVAEHAPIISSVPVVVRVIVIGTTRLKIDCDYEDNEDQGEGRAELPGLPAVCNRRSNYGFC
jgi:hypothetical protein